MGDYKADQNAHQLDFQNTSLFFSRQFAKRFITKQTSVNDWGYLRLEVASVGIF